MNQMFVDTWPKFFNTVKLAEMRINGEYEKARKAGDEAGAKTALGKYTTLNALLDELLASLRGVAS